MQNDPAILILNSGEGTGFQYKLQPDQKSLIGRDWQCKVVLNDPQCSRVHAEVYRNEDGWWIRDNQSSNGTWVNGQTIDQARLVGGTELQIGNSRFSFLESEMVSSSDQDGPGPGRSDDLSTNVRSEVESSDGSLTRSTVILDQPVHGGEDVSATLEFLQGKDWGKDFFFLFQLAVKLLSNHEPDQVASICMKRLASRAGAEVAGYLWLSESGELTPKLVLPGGETGKVQLDADLTKRVVAEKKAIRAKCDTGGRFADLICVPLVADETVIGAIHLYRQSRPFQDSVFELAVAISNIMVRALATANRHCLLAAQHSRLVQQSATFDELKGESQPMRELKVRIERVAPASGCVLVRGESGSGKELVARAIHRASPRADRPMLSVNCAAIPRELMESQLFGHRKGAFTSADRDHVGWFQQADLGTLFLDEIGELTLEGQAKLLRTLEGHPFRVVGGTEEIKVDVRVICATNRDLKKLVSERRFREDLYYRLSVYELHIPPLRERGGDIEMLVDFFFQHFRDQHGRLEMQMPDEVRLRLLNYDWPGNVRQLRNVIDSAVIMAAGNQLDLADLGIREADGEGLESLRIDHWERKLIQDGLSRTSGSVPKAAKLLGISRATLYRKIEDYGIQR